MAITLYKPTVTINGADFEDNSELIVLIANTAASFSNTYMGGAFDLTANGSGTDSARRYFIWIKSTRQNLSVNSISMNNSASGTSSGYNGTLTSVTSIPGTGIRSYTPVNGQLSSYSDYTYSVAMYKVEFTNALDHMHLTLSLKDSSSTVEYPKLTYNIGSEPITVTPTSPIEMTKDITLVATLNNGYTWDDTEQQILIGSSFKDGVVSGQNCSWSISADDVAEDTELEWYLYYTEDVEPTYYLLRYTIGDDDLFTASPSSPIEIDSDTTLTVTVFDGYSFSGTQYITVGSTKVTGTVSGDSCTFVVTPSMMTAETELVWGLTIIDDNPSPTYYNVTYSIGTSDKFTASPSSPFTVSEDTNLVVTLDSGYHWDGTTQRIILGSSEYLIDGTISGLTCTFKISTTMVTKNMGVTWALNYSKDSTPTPTPSESRRQFFTVYEPTDDNMETINSAIFASSDGTVINVLGYFSSYKRFFVEIPTAGTKTLKAGRYDFGVSSPYVSQLKIDYDCGSVSVDEKYGNLLDYNPYTSIRIYLPFIGFEDLDVDMVMGHTLSIVYTVDVLSGRCMAKLTSDATGKVFAQFGGTIAADEMLGSTSDLYFDGSYELLTSLQLGGLGIYLIVDSSSPIEGNIADYEGYPSKEVVKVGDVNGYVEYDRIFAKGMNCSEVEKSEIESLLKSGILVD